MPRGKTPTSPTSPNRALPRPHAPNTSPSRHTSTRVGEGGGEGKTKRSAAETAGMRESACQTTRRHFGITSLKFPHPDTPPQTSSTSPTTHPTPHTPPAPPPKTARTDTPPHPPTPPPSPSPSPATRTSCSRPP